MCDPQHAQDVRRRGAVSVRTLSYDAGARGPVARHALRAAIGLSRERFEEAYEFLGTDPPLGLAVQRYGDKLRLVTAPEVCSSVERHLNNPKPVSLSNAALEVLAIVAYRQPIARSGIEHIRGSASDSAIEKLLERGLLPTIRITCSSPHVPFWTWRV